MLENNPNENIQEAIHAWIPLKNFDDCFIPICVLAT